MAADDAQRFDLLRGRIDLAEPYRSPRRGGDRPPPPPRDPAAHQQLLLAQLDEIYRNVGRREFEARDAGATRELVVLKPEPGAEINADSFADSRYDVRVVSKDEETGVVLIDAKRPDLPHIRSKLERFADETRVSATTGARSSERAIAPLSALHLARAEDLAGPALRSADLHPDDVRWFELSCRGGRRAPTRETELTRGQIHRTLAHLGYSGNAARPQEFLAPERILFFVRLPLSDLRALVARTDCIYELDLAGPPVRDWLLFTDQEVPARELRDFRLTCPPVEAPSVVVLDTGIVSQHPMLREAILSSHSVLPGVDSPEDTSRIGHGTMMAGIALYEEVGTAVERNAAKASHWIQSVKLLRDDQEGIASEEHREFWPALTERAVETAEAAGRPSERQRVFVMAVTAPLADPPAATSWSQAVDQLAYGDGRGRLLLVSIGNVDINDRSLAQSYPHLHLDQHIFDPAQAVNALTVGAYTVKTVLPPHDDFDSTSLSCLAPEGGVSPYTRAGVNGAPIKPDVVFEGGNAVFDGDMAYTGTETLSTLTTGRDFTRNPLAMIWATSCAAAHAAGFAGRLWTIKPDLRPETVRGLIVHSASWTPQMLTQFQNLDQRLALCGYGVPEEAFATTCVRSRATVIVEDEMPNAVFTPAEADPDVLRKQRLIKYFRLPIPEDLLLSAADEENVELRITLSYFAEPSTTRRRESLGLELAFDVQGAQESEQQFRERVNYLLRPKRDREGAAPEAGEQPNGSLANEHGNRRGWSGYWAVGPHRRGRGTVQSDRLQVPPSLLAGSKLIAVYPVFGWWDRRDDTVKESMPFSLIATLQAPARDVYTPISQALLLPVELPAV